MKNFIKIAPLALALIIAPDAYANNNQKIAFVKKMYAEQKRVKNSNAAIQKYGTAEFKQALGVFNRNSQIMDCVPLSGDPFFNSNDPDYNAKINYTVNAQGNVVAHIASYGYHSQSTFVLVKSGNGYKLADIYYKEGSLKNNLSNC
ncbi:hypothetical protein ACFBZI_09905 [Moraxella sp. ZJ142]|uniref:hypothetical protein n=1 Tax=Moraxella marmotae TaxID=3344520 RepID=UPI0035D4E9B8